MHRLCDDVPADFFGTRCQTTNELIGVGRLLQSELEMQRYNTSFSFADPHAAIATPFIHSNWRGGSFCVMQALVFHMVLTATMHSGGLMLVVGAVEDADRVSSRLRGPPFPSSAGVIFEPGEAPRKVFGMVDSVDYRLSNLELLMAAFCGVSPKKQKASAHAVAATENAAAVIEKSVVVS